MTEIHRPSDIQPGKVVCDTFGKIFTTSFECDVLLEPAEFISSDEDKHVLKMVRSWLAAHSKVHSIEIKIPKFTDGRGFSIAARLREAGYAGELHASGDITQDLIFLLRRVGFTHFHLILGVNEEINQNILNPFSAHYQGAQDGSLAIWHQGRGING